MNRESTLMELQQVLRKADMLITQLLYGEENLTPAEGVKTAESLEEKVTNYLKKYEIPAHIKGYNYLRTAIMMAINDRSLLESIMKGLYPAVAKEYDTIGPRVERACRHAIDVSTHEKVTNSQFIAEIVDEICLGKN